MSKIVFFNIPAHGHTNPTLNFVSELVSRGHTVRYYSFNMFKEKIESVGAEFISCDDYLPPLPDDFEKRSRYDFSSLLEMLVTVTLSMEEVRLKELKEFNPDCIVYDSMCLWGKLYSQKLNIPSICSTTSFAFNDATAKLMRPGLVEIFYTLKSTKKMKAYIKELRGHGYLVNKIVDLIQNDIETDTVVYTSSMFQPESDTFGEKYDFIGPSITELNRDNKSDKRKYVYISLGTVMKEIDFYQNCIEAFRDSDEKIIMSIGDLDIKELKNIPDNFVVRQSVNQIDILSESKVFITHCGMNSVNESIYFNVPMIMFPQTSEQGLVARRAEKLGCGLFLKNTKSKTIFESVTKLNIDREDYLENIAIVSDSFKHAGGVERAANKVEEIIKKHSK